MRAGKNNENSADLIGFWFFIGGFGLRIFLGGETSFFLTLIFVGKMIQFDLRIFFHMGCFNHQLVF